MKVFLFIGATTVCLFGWLAASYLSEVELETYADSASILKTEAKEQVITSN